MTTPTTDTMYLYLVAFTYIHQNGQGQVGSSATVYTATLINSEDALEEVSRELAHRAGVTQIAIMNINLLRTPDRSTR